VASFVWMLLAEPTYNRMRLTAFAWRARILSQKAPRNVSRLSPGHAGRSPSPLPRRRASFRAQGPGGRQCGKRVQRWKGGFATKKEAQAFTDVLSRLGDGSYVQPTKLTLRAFVDHEWLPAIAGTVRPLTLTQYRSVMKGRILPRLGHVRLQAVTGGHPNGLYRELEDEGLSPASRRLTHAVLSRTFRDAVRWGRLVRNPAAAADPPAAAQSRVTALTEKELGRFLEQVKGNRLFALCRLAATVSGRRSPSDRAGGSRSTPRRLRRCRFSARRSCSSGPSPETATSTATSSSATSPAVRSTGPG